MLLLNMTNRVEIDIVCKKFIYREKFFHATVSEFGD